MATLVALLGAMFVAMGSVSAQTATTYSGPIYCTATNPNDANTLEITDSKMRHDDMRYLSYTDNPSEAGAEDVTVVASGAAQDCGDIDSGTSGEDAIAGDLLVIAKTGDGGTADDPDDDAYGWRRAYKELRTDVDATKTITLLTDNPDNPKAGGTTGNMPRPQKWNIPSISGEALETGDKIESSDKSNSVVMIGAYSTASGWAVTAGKVGTATVTATDVNSDNGLTTVRTYTFEVKEGTSAAAAAATTERSVTIEIDDTDDTVGNAATAHHWFTITTKNIPALSPTDSDGTQRHLRVYVSGELEDEFVHTGARVDGRIVDPPIRQTLDDAGMAEYRGTITVPKGTTPGEYTLDVTIYTDGATSMTYNPGGDFKGYSGSDVLIVGDAGSNVSEAVLVLSPLDADGDPVAEGTSQKTQPSSSAAKGDPIRLTLTSLNALGNASNPRINVTVTAAGATIKHSHSVNAEGAYVAASGVTRDNSLQFYSSAASVVVEITKDTPGAVEVSALVVDPVGSGYDGSDKVTLTFTGPAKTVSLSDATTTLLNRYVDHKADDDDTDTDPRDNISLKLTASDADGHAVVPTGSATVTIAGPDGSMVATDGAGQKIVVSQKVAGTANTISLQVAASVTAASPLKSGEYTVTAKDGARKDTATFTVVGLADTVSMEASEADEDGQIEVTVTVTDADGNHVADGTAVEVMAADLRGDSDPVILRTSTTGKTKAGVAKATFIEVGYGPAAIIATADGKTDVVRVTSTFDAPVPEAMPEEEASVSCLSELSGFATWSCGVEADASEIFDMVAGRGVTAIHLWNGSTWVRYSVVDGAMVPGSSDFMVTKSDILYISN